MSINSREREREFVGDAIVVEQKGVWTPKKSQGYNRNGHKNWYFIGKLYCIWKSRHQFQPSSQNICIFYLSMTIFLQMEFFGKNWVKYTKNLLLVWHGYTNSYFVAYILYMGQQVSH